MHENAHEKQKKQKLPENAPRFATARPMVGQYLNQQRKNKERRENG